MKELTKGNTSTIILAMLRSDTMYGYQIVKELNERHVDVMRMNEGTVYPLLHGLENQGLVKGSWKKLDGKKSRKYYRLTAKGETVLDRSIAQWRSFSSALDGLLGGAH